MKINTSVDLNFLDRAEKEASQILLKQRLAFNIRWYSKSSVMKIINILRFFGLFLCILGFVITIIALVIEPEHRPPWLQVAGYFLFFILGGSLLYFFPSMDRTIKNWINHRSIISCKRLAKKCMKAARKAVPFQAEYDIKGDLITYYRGNDDIWKLAWSRRLKGIAIHGTSTTLFFRKQSSIQPIMVILHKDFSSLETALSDLNIDYKPMSVNEKNL